MYFKAGRKNRAYAIIQNDLQEKERKNKKMALTNERVMSNIKFVINDLFV